MFCIVVEEADESEYWLEIINDEIGIDFICLYDRCQKG